MTAGIIPCQQDNTGSLGSGNGVISTGSLSGVGGHQITPVGDPYLQWPEYPSGRLVHYCVGVGRQGCSLGNHHWPGATRKLFLFLHVSSAQGTVFSVSMQVHQM